MMTTMTAMTILDGEPEVLAPLAVVPLADDVVVVVTAGGEDDDVTATGACVAGLVVNSALVLCMVISGLVTVVE